MGEGARGRRTSPPARQAEVRSPLEAITLLGALVQDAVRALFRTYGVEVDLDGSLVRRTLESVELVSIIGFSSADISGSLSLAMPSALVERALPAPEANLADWSGELANQLLGRLKNQLLDYNLAIDMSLPVVIAGAELALPATARHLTQYYSFASDWGRMLVRTELDLSPGLELVREAGPSSKQRLDEGELLLF
jgi:CheY-specific phosphatase CheX